MPNRHVSGQRAADLHRQLRVGPRSALGTALAELQRMKRYLALLVGVLGSVACSKQPPPHTADDSSWVRVSPSQPSQPEPELKAETLQQSLAASPNPWAPPNTSQAANPTSMNKAPPATEAGVVASPAPSVPNAMPQPEPL